MMECGLVTYNCRGLPYDNIKFKCKPSIFNILNNPLASIVLFQETFYTKQDLPFLNNLSPDYNGVGTASVDAKTKTRCFRWVKAVPSAKGYTHGFSAPFSFHQTKNQFIALTPPISVCFAL